MSSRAIIVALLVVGAILVGRSVGRTIGRDVARAVIHRGERPRAWKSHALGELSVTAPGSFTREPANFVGDAGDDVERLVQSSELFRSTSGDLVVLVARFTYRDEVSVSLDGAASGAMQQMRATAE